MTSDHELPYDFIQKATVRLLIPNDQFYKMYLQMNDKLSLSFNFFDEICSRI